MESIPDFEDMLRIAENIKNKLKERILLDNQIKQREAEITREITTNPLYFQNNKPPSMAYIETTFIFTGIRGELIPLRNQLADIISDLEGSKLVFEIMKMQVDIYRTNSANQRHATL